jgi:hypothetical protein
VSCSRKKVSISIAESSAFVLKDEGGRGPRKEQCSFFRKYQYLGIIP